MNEIILRHRHTVVKNHLLHLGKIHSTDLLISLKFLHELCHIIGTITGINISLDDIARNRKLGIERHFRILRVATKTATVSKDLINLLIQRKFCRRNTIDRPIDNGQRSSCYQQPDCSPFD